MRKLSDDECPLYLRLCAGPSEKVLSLVLKENETGDVNVGFLLALKLVFTINLSIHAELYIQLVFVCLFLTWSVSLHSGMRLVFPSCATFCES